MVAILFDLDGTLYDDRTYIKAGFRSAAAQLQEEYNIETFGDMVWEYAVERNYETVFDHILELYNLPPDELENLIASYHDATSNIRPYPDTERMLENLPDEYQTAVITGGKHGETKLRELGLGSTFDQVYVTPEQETTKREALPFETVIETFDISPERSIFVGNNPELDFYWPNRLNMTTVWVRRRTTLFQAPQSIEIRPDYVFPDLSLVVEVAKRLQAESDKTT